MKLVSLAAVLGVAAATAPGTNPAPAPANNPAPAPANNPAPAPATNPAPSAGTNGPSNPAPSPPVMPTYSDKEPRATRTQCEAFVQALTTPGTDGSSASIDGVRCTPPIHAERPHPAHAPLHATVLRLL